MEKRLKALEAKSLQEGLVLTEAQAPAADTGFRLSVVNFPRNAQIEFRI